MHLIFINIKYIKIIYYFSDPDFFNKEWFSKIKIDVGHWRLKVFLFSLKVILFFI